MLSLAPEYRFDVVAMWSVRQWLWCEVDPVLGGRKSDIYV